MAVTETNIVLFKAISEESRDDPYVKYFSENGYHVTIVPPIDFEFINTNCLTEKLNHPENYSGIILSSPRCVKALQLASKSKSWTQLPAFVVGETTDKEARALGLNCSGKDAGNASRLAEFIISRQFEKRLLYPKSNLASDVLEVTLTKANVLLDPLEIYKTVPHPKLGENIQGISLPAKLVFFSPSGVESVLHFLVNVDSQLSQLYAIGETTEKAIKSRGLTVSGRSSKPTPEALLAAINRS